MNFFPVEIMPDDSFNDAGLEISRAERDGSAGVGEASHQATPQLCPACGAQTRRSAAQYCATCGRRLDGEDYFPTDTLRASYHQQRRTPEPPHVAFKPSAGTLAAALTTEELSRHHNSSSSPPRVVRRVKSISAMPSNVANHNGASTTALAFVTYALVPYLGILFCPGALVFGSIGLVRAIRAPHVGGRRTSVTSIVLGVVILGAQLVLWWILYKVPEWSRGAAGF